MKPPLVAAVWIAGSTIPLFAATIFLAGCCVLPFHRVLHKLMPLCNIAASVMRGEHAEQSDTQSAASIPARQEPQPAKRFVTLLPGAFRVVNDMDAGRTAAPRAMNAYRSFITLGAVRCDQDVGLHVLIETFLI